MRNIWKLCLLYLPLTLLGCEEKAAQYTERSSEAENMDSGTQSDADTDSTAADRTAAQTIDDYPVIILSRNNAGGGDVVIPANGSVNTELIEKAAEEQKNETTSGKTTTISSQSNSNPEPLFSLTVGPSGFELTAATNSNGPEPSEIHTVVSASSTQPSCSGSSSSVTGDLLAAVELEPNTLYSIAICYTPEGATEPVLLTKTTTTTLAAAPTIGKIETDKDGLTTLDLSTENNPVTTEYSLKSESSTSPTMFFDFGNGTFSSQTELWGVLNSSYSFVATNSAGTTTVSTKLAVDSDYSFMIASRNGDSITLGYSEESLFTTPLENQATPVIDEDAAAATAKAPIEEQVTSTTTELLVARKQVQDKASVVKSTESETKKAALNVATLTESLASAAKAGSTKDVKRLKALVEAAKKSLDDLDTKSKKAKKSLAKSVGHKKETTKHLKALKKKHRKERREAAKKKKAKEKADKKEKKQKKRKDKKEKAKKAKEKKHKKHH